MFICKKTAGIIPLWILEFKDVEELTAFTWAIRQALRENGITGADSQEIDHIELFGPSHVRGVDGKNFRALSRQSIRSIALRHRDQRQAGMPLR